MILDRDSYRRILDNLYDGLYLLDTDRVIRYWNGAAEQISGFTASEVVGKSCSDNILTHVNEKGDSLCMGLCPVAMTMPTESLVKQKSSCITKRVTGCPSPFASLPSWTRRAR